MKLRAAALLGVAAVSLPSEALAAPRFQLAIPAGRLGDTIILLGRQTGTSIGISDPHLANRRVGALRGSHTVREALNRILRPIGARAIFAGPDAVRIVAAGRPPSSPKQAQRPPLPPQREAARPPEPASEEIVVVASLRRLRERNYPGSAQIIFGDDPAFQSGVPGSEALIGRSASVNSTHLGSGRNKLFIRGIADSSFNGPTQATVGQYLGASRLNYNSPDPDLRLIDLERVEILSGPQGTLYGAGSLGGIVKIIPNAPELDRNETIVSAGLAATRHGEAGGDASAVLNIPLARDRMAARLVGYAKREGGYIDDVGRGAKDINRVAIAGGRATLRAQLSDQWRVDLTLLGQRINGRDAQYSDRAEGPLERRTDLAQGFRNRYLLGGAEIVREWGDLRWTTGATIVDQRLTERFQADLKPNIILPLALTVQPILPISAVDQRTSLRFASVETLLSRRTGDGSGWLLGASLLSNQLRQERDFGPVDAMDEISEVDNEVQDLAVFGEFSTQIASGTEITTGVRLSRSRLQGSAFSDYRAISSVSLAGNADVTLTQTGWRSQTRFLPSAAISKRLTENATGFLRLQKSFRPGGIALQGNEVAEYRPDVLTAFEAGLRYHRGDHFQGSTSLSLANWKSIQVDTVDLVGLPLTANAGDARILSVDVRAQWKPTRHLELDSGILWNDGRAVRKEPAFQDFSKLPNVARYNLRLQLRHHSDIASGVSFENLLAVRYSSKSSLGVGPLFSRKQGGWADLKWVSTVSHGRNTFHVAIDNVLNVAGNRFALGSPFTINANDQTTPLRPRTLRSGLTLIW